MKNDAQKIKTGLLGGTFDPIHLGHIRMALTAASEFDLSEVWLMPNGSPPHKNDRYISAKPSDRLSMTELAISDAKQEMGESCPLVLCDYEIKRKKTSYSYETMEYFNTLYPDRTFFFIIGADSLMTLTEWRCPDRLLKTCVMLAAVRGDEDELDLKSKIVEYQRMYPGSDIRILHMPAIDISSSEIRLKLAAGEDIRAMVSPSVAEYIKRNKGLYCK